MVFVASAIAIARGRCVVGCSRGNVHWRSASADIMRHLPNDVMGICPPFVVGRAETVWFFLSVVPLNRTLEARYIVLFPAVLLARRPTATYLRTGISGSFGCIIQGNTSWLTCCRSSSRPITTRLRPKSGCVVFFHNTLP